MNTPVQCSAKEEKVGRNPFFPELSFHIRKRTLYDYLAFKGWLCSQVGEQHFFSKVSMFSSFVCHMAHKEVKLQPMGRVFKTSALGSCVQF